MSNKPETNAVLIHPSKQVHSQITEVITGLLNGLPVTLAQSAFTTEPRVLVERQQHVDSKGLPLQGRSLDIPQAFTLVKRGDACFIKHEKSGESVLLKGVNCRPVTDAAN